MVETKYYQGRINSRIFCTIFSFLSYRMQNSMAKRKETNSLPKETFRGVRREKVGKDTVFFKMVIFQNPNQLN